MTANDLMKHTYIKFPYWAINSTKAPSILTKEEYGKVLESQPVSKETLLFTIGYEGVSLEEYLNRLIRNDVKILVDVRRNALSMKYGFSKSRPKRYCNSIGIKYVHFPKVGIHSQQRQELNNQKDYDALFSTTVKNFNTVIKILEHIDTKGNWLPRKDIVFKNKIHTDLDQLIQGAKDKKTMTSLATFKPNKIIDFVWKSVEREWERQT